MAYRKRRKFGRRRGRLLRRNYRTKNYKRGKNGATSVIVRHPTIIPDKLYCKLRFYTSFTQSQATGLSISLCGGNMPRDPTTASLGQPPGWDQYVLLYGNYRCYGSKIRVVVQTSNTSNRAIIGVIPSKSSTADYAAMNYMAPAPYAVTKYMNIAGSGNDQVFIKRYFSTAKMFGLKKGVIESDDKYAALVTADPSDKWYWHFYGGEPSELGQYNLRWFYTITYYVCFYNRNKLTDA